MSLETSLTYYMYTTPPVGVIERVQENMTNVKLYFWGPYGEGTCYVGFANEQTKELVHASTTGVHNRLEKQSTSDYKTPTLTLTIDELCKALAKYKEELNAD